MIVAAKRRASSALSLTILINIEKNVKKGLILAYNRKNTKDCHCWSAKKDSGSVC